jgi:hypothetical protein
MKKISPCFRSGLRCSNLSLEQLEEYKKLKNKYNYLDLEAEFSLHDNDKKWRNNAGVLAAILNKSGGLSLAEIASPLDCQKGVVQDIVSDALVNVLSEEKVSLYNKLIHQKSKKIAKKLGMKANDY